MLQSAASSLQPPTVGQLVNVGNHRFFVTTAQASSTPANGANRAETFVSLSSVEDDVHGEELQVVWNALHSPESQNISIEPSRELLRRHDLPVRDSYAWVDLELEHGFHSVSHVPENDRIRHTVSLAARLDILKRLLLLNLKRWKAEQAEALAAINEVKAAQETAEKPRRKSGPMLMLVADFKQPGLF